MTATLEGLRELTRRFAKFAEPMTATLVDLRKLTGPLSAFAAFQAHFLSAELEVAFEDLRGTVSAEEMDKEENDRSDKEKVNQRGSQMEDDKCPNPLRNTNLIRSPSELHGITQQSGGVDSQGHIPRRVLSGCGQQRSRVSRVRLKVPNKS
jgi:hypothetical protein